MSITVVRENAEIELLKESVSKGIDQTFIVDKINEIKSTTSQHVKDSYIPKFYLIVVVILFTVSNLSITYILYNGFNSDIDILLKLKPEDMIIYHRLIDTNVVIALVAGTTTQVGASFYLITKFFTRSSSKKRND